MDIELTEIQKVLKRIIKAKGLTYSDLAALMDLSESGIKKMLTSNDLSFNRIKSICEALEVGFADVIAEVNESEVREEQFTDAQERFFLKNQDYFHFFWKLVVERDSLEKIKRENTLNDKQISKYLTKLDSFNIIELHPNNRIKIPRRESKRWVGTGPLTQKVQKDWGSSLWNEAIQKNFNEEDGAHTFVRHLKLSPTSFDDLKLALEDLEKEFVSRSTREQSLSKDELKTFRLLAATAEGSFIERI